MQGLETVTEIEKESGSCRQVPLEFRETTNK